MIFDASVPDRSPGGISEDDRQTRECKADEYWVTIKTTGHVVVPVCASSEEEARSEAVTDLRSILQVHGVMDDGMEYEVEEVEVL